jgi:AraC-like DNA-binding protein
VGELQKHMSMSREHMFRKLKALTGQSPSEMIRIMRLKLAASLLEKGEESITRISMQVGFSNPSYFSQCFREYYGQKPSDYKLKNTAGYTP